jgi:hypothetical protein
MGCIPNLVDNGGIRFVLPIGRYLATLDEIEARFVPKGDANRREIFDRFLAVLDVAKEMFGSICSVWVGGSFVTSEISPHDIDIVFLVRPEDFEHAYATEYGKLFLHLLCTKHGFDEKIDAFFFVIMPSEAEWDLYAETDIGRYLNIRGYWDRLWSQSRFADPHDQRAFFPSAGYLEVVIDGFIR